MRGVLARALTRRGVPGYGSTYTVSRAGRVPAACADRMQQGGTDAGLLHEVPREARVEGCPGGDAEERAGGDAGDLRRLRDQGHRHGRGQGRQGLAAGRDPSRPAAAGRAIAAGPRRPARGRGTMTTLKNRPHTALLVVDVQNGVVAGAHARDAVVANIGTLVERARRGGV